MKKNTSKHTIEDNAGEESQASFLIQNERCDTEHVRDIFNDSENRELGGENSLRNGRVIFKEEDRVIESGLKPENMLMNIRGSLISSMQFTPKKTPEKKKKIKIRSFISAESENNKFNRQNIKSDKKIQITTLGNEKVAREKMSQTVKLCDVSGIFETCTMPKALETHYFSPIRTAKKNTSRSSKMGGSLKKLYITLGSDSNKKDLNKAERFTGLELNEVDKNPIVTSPCFPKKESGDRHLDSRYQSPRFGIKVESKRNLQNKSEEKSQSASLDSIDRTLKAVKERRQTLAWKRAVQTSEVRNAILDTRSITTDGKKFESTVNRKEYESPNTIAAKGMLALMDEIDQVRKKREHERKARQSVVQDLLNRHNSQRL